MNLTSYFEICQCRNTFLKPLLKFTVTYFSFFILCIGCFSVFTIFYGVHLNFFLTFCYLMIVLTQLNFFGGVCVSFLNL